MRISNLLTHSVSVHEPILEQVNVELARELRGPEMALATERSKNVKTWRTN